jgi:hypothetical protein
VVLVRGFSLFSFPHILSSEPPEPSMEYFSPMAGSSPIVRS